MHKTISVTLQQFRISGLLQVPMLDEIMGRKIQSHYLHFVVNRSHNRYAVHYTLQDPNTSAPNAALKKANPEGPDFHGDMIILKIGTGPVGYVQVRPIDMEEVEKVAIL